MTYKRSAQYSGLTLLAGTCSEALSLQPLTMVKYHMQGTLYTLFVCVFRPLVAKLHVVSVSADLQPPLFLLPACCAW